VSTEVLYRKWRSRTFGELAGQDAVARTLTNAVSAGKVSHAYLFSGPRGTGKTSTGRLLARAVNCTNPNNGEPCNECESCRNLLESRDFEFLVELDAASNRGIDEIRSLREKANFGGGGTYKVYLIDEVHMLTDAAFNALLKTLEEPPAHVIFVLATTEAHKVPATISSRCQRFDFRRIPLAAIVERLRFIAGQEAIECPDDALEVIARTATGSMRDAINLLEQLVDSYGRTLTIDQAQEGLGLVVDARSGELALHALRGELAEGLTVISSVRDDGIDLRQFQRQVVAQLRGLLLAKAEAAPTDAWSEEQLNGLRAEVSEISAQRIVTTLSAFGEADLRADPLSPLPLELALASAALAETEPQPATASQGPRTSTASAPAGAPRRAPVEAARKAPVAGRQQETAPPSNGAPAPPPSTTTGHPAQASVNVQSVEEVRENWPRIYDRTRAIDFRAGALLNSECGIVGISDDELVFAFRRQIHFDRMHADGGDNLRALQQAVDDVLGPGRTVRCVLDPDVSTQTPRPRGGHLVRAAEELGGQVMSEPE
jgi:DNA polymerase-3 subunit gamma/tau